MEEIKKRVLTGKSSDYFQDQLDNLDEISAKSGIKRASLLREGADYIIDKYKKFLSKK
jgi:hypothetical protein